MAKYPKIMKECMGLVILLLGGFLNAQDAETRIDLKRKALDETVWVNEVRAERYGDTIAKFWDEIREAENPLDVFRTFSLGAIETPQWTLNRRLPEKIFEFIHRAPMSGIKYLKSYQFETMLNQFEKEGYSVDQVDFRHSGFEVNPDGVGISRVEFEMNVSGPTHTLYRRSFQGTARIVWSEELGEDDLYYPQSISFENFRQYRRTGKSGFESSDWLDGEDSWSAYSVILVEDFDLDGRPDILFPRANMLYRNVGDFRFDPRPFVKHQVPAAIDAALLIDVDLDGEREYIVTTRGLGVLLFEPNRKSGQFDQKPKTLVKPKRLFSGFSMTAGDLNEDGFPDLFIGQNVEAYVRGLLPDPIFDSNDSLPSFLLINQGAGKFREMTDKSGVSEKSKRRIRTSSIVDLNLDGQMDLVMTSNFAGVDVFAGSDASLLEDRTSEWLEEPELFGSSHVIADFNRDGKLDLFAAGSSSEVGRRMSKAGSHREGFEGIEAKRAVISKGSRLWLGKNGGGFLLFEDEDVFTRAGSVWGSTDIDFNNDGYPDLYLNNGYISKTTSKNYDEIFWRHDVYDSKVEDKKELSLFLLLEGPGSYLSKDEMSWSPFQKNRLAANFGEEGFVDIAYLMGLSSERDGKATISEDFNMDGKPDLLVVESDSVESQIFLRFLENKMLQTGNWVGVQLRPSKKRSTVGAAVRIIGNDFTAVKAKVFGQSRNAQTSSTLHFGIGEADAIEAIEVQWPDGEKTRMDSPAINRYHVVVPGS